ncbi:MAG: fluoride efflux transporter CrcB [Verrucomicrobia bacterium]|nr:fluoride efflux transporter CrcB [Verrucomicrobiota bacterium]
MRLLWVGLGGFVGAVARYGLSGWVHRGTGTLFPLGTLIVNVTGCLVIGAFLYLFDERGAAGQHAKAFAAIGLLGAFTTFSTLGYETLELLRDRQLWWACLSVLGNVVLGLGAVWLGRTGMQATGF